MGSFFTNVQVYTGGRDSEDYRGEVVDAVRRLMLQDGYVEVDEDEGFKFMLVGPAGRGPWIGVYDSEELPPSELAERLSSAVDGPALGILDHDSDILQLYLFRSGKNVDAFDSKPDYFGDELTAEQRAAVAGRPELWRDLLVGGATPANLRAAWDGKAVFAEDILWRMAPLVGWDPELAATGHGYLMEDGEDLSGFAHLAFRI